mgnify:CR=1 FL=1
MVSHRTHDFTDLGSVPIRSWSDIDHVLDDVIMGTEIQLRSRDDHHGWTMLYDHARDEFELYHLNKPEIRLFGRGGASMMLYEHPQDHVIIVSSDCRPDPEES